MAFMAARLEATGHSHRLPEGFACFSAPLAPRGVKSANGRIMHDPPKDTMGKRPLAAAVRTSQSVIRGNS